MEKAIYYTQPDIVSYMPLPCGHGDVWLRRGITEATDADGSACWECDEVYMRTPLSQAEVLLRFDELFDARAEPAAPSVEERVRDIEAQLEEQACAIEELAVLLAGGD